MSPLPAKADLADFGALQKSASTTDNEFKTLSSNAKSTKRVLLHYEAKSSTLWIATRIP